MTDVGFVLGLWVTDIPRVLEGSPAATRWPQTIREVNELESKKGSMLLWSWFAIIASLLFTGGGVALFVPLDKPNLIGLVLIPIVAIHVVLGIKAILFFRRTKRINRSIQEYLSTESHNFYNAYGINLKFIIATQKPSVNRILIETRLGSAEKAMHQYNTNMPVNYLYSNVPDSSGMYSALTPASGFSGGKPVTGFGGTEV